MFKDFALKLPACQLKGHLPSSPRGMTLLEVLISVFVLMIALLGLISVLPLANRAMEEAARADRAQACGTAALHELQTREILSNLDGRRHVPLSPYSWWNLFLRPIVVDNANVPILNSSQGYAIDPWLIAQTAHRYLPQNNQPIHPNPSAIDRFPWIPVGWTNSDTDWYWPQLTLQRVTLAWPDVWIFSPPPPRALVQKATWLRLFRWEDDLSVGPAPDDLARPILLHVTDSGNNPVKPLANGHFSWLATVSCEDPPDPQTGNLLPLDRPRRYRVSVVVFHKRSLITPLDYDDPAEGPPPERTIVASFLGPSWGGGELRLVVPSDRAGYLEEIRPGQWIMLTGWDPVWQRGVHRWVRIVGVGDIYSSAGGSALARDITVAGPDWNMDPDTGWCLRYDEKERDYEENPPIFADFNGDNISMDVQVCLFSGAIAVYTSIVEVW
jgi:type II secretory pathway pseudopilin PulG